MDMTVRPQSKTLSFLYNNSLASFLMQTSTNTSSRPIYTGINQHKTIPSIWTFIQKANHAQSKSAHVPHPNLHFLLLTIQFPCELSR